MVIFLHVYNLYIFVWIQHDCLATCNTVFSLAIFLYNLYIFVCIQSLGPSAIKRLWCITEIKHGMANSVDPDKTTHKELSHVDPHY